MNGKLKNKKLILATHNEGKIKEFEHLLSGFGIEFLNLSSFKIKERLRNDPKIFQTGTLVSLEHRSL